MAVVSDKGEGPANIERRMREVWARALGWETAGKMFIVGNVEDNELVRLVFGLEAVS